MKINLVMIVKNEEASLERCLSGAAGLTDEIIIVDTGSQDRTKEIAEFMGAAVFDYVWNDDFSAARNFALEQSDADWNLVLDGDEYLHPIGREELEAAIHRYGQKNGSKWMGAIIRYDTYQDEGEISASTALIPRLLPRGVRYTGPIHEQPDSDFPVFRLPLQADHDGYLRADKGERNLPYLEKAAKRWPEDMYYRFQLASTLRNLKRLRESLRWFRNFYRGTCGNEGYRTDGVLLYLYTLLDLGTPDCLSEALNVIEIEKPLLGGRADFCFLSGIFYMKLVLSDVKRYISYLPEIEACYLKCLQIGEHPEEGGVIGAGSFKAAYNLGLWYEVSGNVEKAVHYYRLAAEAGYEPAGARLESLQSAGGK